MKISKSFYDAIGTIVPSAKTLSKGAVVEEMVVTEISDPVEIGPTAPAFLQGKHSIVVTGERDGKPVSCLITAEDMVAAMAEGGVERYHHEGIPAKAGKPAVDEWYEMPDCTFSANGYSQKWSAL